MAYGLRNQSLPHLVCGTPSAKQANANIPPLGVPPALARSWNCAQKVDAPRGFKNQRYACFDFDQCSGGQLSIIYKRGYECPVG